MIQRARRGGTATATLVLYDEEGEAPVDSTSDVTVAVARDDGSVVVPAGTATTKPPGTTGRYQLALSAAHTAELDRLTLTWTTSEGTRTTTVEIVGGHYFEVAELRSANLPASKFTTVQLAGARTWITDLIDRECGTSFVSRYHRAALDGSGVSALALPAPYVRRLLAVTVDDVALTAPQLAALTLDLDSVEFLTGWTVGIANVDVAYVAGWGSAEEPPTDLREAAIEAATNKLLASNTDTPSRARSITNEFGSFSLGYAGKDHPTGYDSVDATIVAWRNRVRIPACA